MQANASSCDPSPPVLPTWEELPGWSGEARLPAPGSDAAPPAVLGLTSCDPLAPPRRLVAPDAGPSGPTLLPPPCDSRPCRRAACCTAATTSSTSHSTCSALGVSSSCRNRSLPPAPAPGTAAAAGGGGGLAVCPAAGPALDCVAAPRCAASPSATPAGPAFAAAAAAPAAIEAAASPSSGRAPPPSPLLVRSLSAPPPPPSPAASDGASLSALEVRCTRWRPWELLLLLPTAEKLQEAAMKLLRRLRACKAELRWLDR